MASIPQTERIDYPHERRSIRALPSIVLTFLLFIGSIVAIGVGLFVSVRSNNDGVAILAAVACALLLNATFSPSRRGKAGRRIYYVRIGSLIWRMYGDEKED